MGAVRVRVWQFVYRGTVEASFVAAMSVEENAIGPRTIEQQGGSRWTFVAVDEPTRRHVGFSMFGPSRIEVDGATFETLVFAEAGTTAVRYDFRVRLDHWASGVSDELMTANARRRY